MGILDDYKSTVAALRKEVEELKDIAYERCHETVLAQENAALRTKLEEVKEKFIWGCQDDDSMCQIAGELAEVKGERDRWRGLSDSADRKISDLRKRVEELEGDLVLVEKVRNKQIAALVEAGDAMKEYIFNLPWLSGSTCGALVNSWIDAKGEG